MLSKDALNSFRERLQHAQGEEVDQIAEELKIYLHTKNLKHLSKLTPAPSADKAVPKQAEAIGFESATQADQVKKDSLNSALNGAEAKGIPKNRELMYLRICLIVLLVLSPILLYFSSFFYFDQYTSHVQKWYEELNQWTYYFFVQDDPWKYVNYYFWGDALWGPVFGISLYLIHLWFVRWNTFEQIKSEGTRFSLGNTIASEKSKWFWLGVLLIVIPIDWSEWFLVINGLKHPGNDSLLSWLQFIVPLKVTLYGLLVLNALAQGLFYVFTRENFGSELKSYLQQNIVTFIVTILLVLILTRLDKGGALVESLLEKPIQYIGIFLLLFNTLILMAWQWPYYHNLFRDRENTVGEFKIIHPFKLISNGVEEARDLSTVEKLYQAFLHIVYLEKPTLKSKESKDKNQLINWFDLQRLQAIGLIVLAMGILIGHWEKSTNPHFPLSYFLVLFIIGIIALYLKLLKHFNAQQNGQTGSNFWRIFNRISWISIGGMGCSFLTILIIYWVHPDLQRDRSIGTLVALLWFLAFNAMFYLPLMIGRSKLKDSGREWMITKLFGKDPNFMLLLMIAGWSSLVIVIFLNLFYSFNSWMHPINIALIYLILLFSALNLFTKGAQVVLREVKNPLQDHHTRLRVNYLGFMGGIGILLVGLYSFSSNNHFHELEQITIQGLSTEKNADSTNTYPKGIPFNTYFESRWESAYNSNTQESEHPFLMIAADGGGLRACYWTLLVLEKLDRRYGYKLFDRTLAMSGSSGGMIGLGMYSVIKMQYPDNPGLRRAAIERIGSANFVSNDFTFLLGMNIFKNFILGDISSWEDGAEKMARKYIELVLQDSSQSDAPYHKESWNQDYRSVWLAGYEQMNGKFPLLLTNSTQSETAIKGIASPLQNEDKIFKAAISMLDFEVNPRHSLSFTDALFSCNRFPIFSQAAEIRTKGHFIDAGGFDNSGVSSLIDLLDYMELENPSLFNQYKENIILISIHNDGVTYIRDNFDKYLDKRNRIDPIGEISPLVNVGASRGTTGEPIYMDERMEQLEAQKVLKDYVEISLPFPLTREKVQAPYKGQLQVDLPMDQEIKRKDFLTKSALGKDSVYIVEPPLGRIMSNAVLSYMKKMITQEEVVAALDTITQAK